MTTYFLIRNLNASEDEIMGRPQSLLDRKASERAFLATFLIFFWLRKLGRRTRSVTHPAPGMTGETRQSKPGEVFCNLIVGERRQPEALTPGQGRILLRSRGSPAISLSCLALGKGVPVPPSPTAVQCWRWPQEHDPMNFQGLRDFAPHSKTESLKASDGGGGYRNTNMHANILPKLASFLR
ncbi:hypothetical protein GH733_006676 [Mirounga leonina]|nr:hypothetical protein GH733_006676 [Mirounga leonina]